ncbi:MAG TPA: VWA domain-containing protein [Blastocatellia bacterium]|nr:VWA domain-containing protein [Blastocatellia bacterium]
MSIKALAKILVVAALVALAGWRVIGHPAYLDLYANDPRSKPDLRAKCAICHEPTAKAKDPNFLTEFGAEFRANLYRITPEMRERYTDIFLTADQPVSGLAADTLSFATTQVLVNVTVRNARGKYVSTLDRKAFTLLEDDKEQEVSEFFGEDAPMAVAMVLDVSGSVIEKDLERYRNSALDLAYRLKPDDTLALYTFDEKGVQKVRDYSSTVAGLKPLLKQLKGEGNTPLYDAILLASQELRVRPERRRALVLISDGADSASQATLREVEKQTFLAGVAVYAIDLVNTEKSARRSVERQASAQTLKQIAQESGGRYITTEDKFFLMPSRMKLKQIFKDLIAELHSQYAIAYEPTNSRRDGRWRTIRVNMEQADLTARTRLGYREAVQ